MFWCLLFVWCLSTETRGRGRDTSAGAGGPGRTADGDCQPSPDHQSWAHRWVSALSIQVLHCQNGMRSDFQGVQIAIMFFYVYTIKHQCLIMLEYF